MRRVFQLLSVFLLLLGSAFFFVGGPELSGARSAQRAWDLGHLVFFFLATAVWLQWDTSGEQRPTVRTWVLALGMVNLAGCLIEGAQYVLGRSPSISDLFLNNVGTILALTFVSLRRSSARSWRTAALFGAALALLAWSLIPILAALSDEYSASRAFPVLSDFETPFQISRWTSDVELSIEREHVRYGNGAMRVPLSTERYSTASLKYFPSDWSGASSLAVSIFNPDPEPLELHLRVHDRWHDDHGQSYDERFNRSFTVLTGWNDLVFPMSDIENGPRYRTLNLSEIRGLSIFSVELPSPRTIFIDQLELR